MFSHEIAYLVNQECQKDRLRELERQWLIRGAGLQQPGYDAWAGKVIDWIGTQLVTWGSMLRRINPVRHQALYRRR